MAAVHWVTLAVLACAVDVHAQTWLPPSPREWLDPMLQLGAAPSDGVPSPQAAAEPGATDEADPEVVVHLKDGRQVRGLLGNGTEDEVVVRIEGVTASFKKEAVERVDRLPSLLDRYRELRAAVGDDAEQVLQLARWLQSRDRFELALAEARRARDLDSTSAEAQRLCLILEEQVRLKASRVAPARREDHAPVPEPSRRPHDFFPTLNPAQINLIKVYELELSDKPRLMIPRAAVERMLDAYAEHPGVPATREGRDALLRRPAEDIVALMFELRARDYYADVQVLDTPKSITSFRDAVARSWLTNSCATTQCHGGADAGRFALTSRRVGSEASVFTNLLILTRFKTIDGRGLINWEAPERSLLLQYGLPRKVSIAPHPDVPIPNAGGQPIDAWRPAFRSTADPLFRSGVRWIESMRRPRSDWPVDYRPIAPFSVEPPARPESPKPPTSDVSRPPAPVPPAPEPNPR